MRKWLREARENGGLTMKQMAEKLLISESYYCAIENGTRQRNMDISLAERISETLQIPIKEILRNESMIRKLAGVSVT